MIVDLERKHLTEMMELRLLTQRDHHRMHPDIFHETPPEPQVIEELSAYLPPRWPWRKRRIEAWALGWQEGDGLLAYLLWYILRDHNAPLNPYVVGYVADIATRPECRRQGIGEKLLGAVTSDAKSLGVTALHADIWCGNDASMRFFERAGYRPLLSRVALRLDG